MRFRWTISLLLLFSLQKGMAQLYDQNWIVSDSAERFVFNNNQINKEAIKKQVDTHSFWAGISDENGNFEFFTNSFGAYDSSGTLLYNGYDLSDSAMEAYWGYGSHSRHAGLIFPRGNRKYWFINQSFSDTYFNSTGNWQYLDNLYYAEIDMNARGGAGEVTSKKNLLYHAPMCDKHLTACKHANGRDYWLVVNGYLDSTYIKFLVTPDAILGPYIQSIGYIYPYPFNAGQFTFSQDGEKFAGVSAESKLCLMDFDRCTGTFSNSRTFVIPPDTFLSHGVQYYLLGGGGSVIFSPSGRYLYLERQLALYQYDLQSSDIAGTRKIIYMYRDSFPDGQVYDGYITPLGQILICNNITSGHGFNIILNPDQSDTLCHFIKEDSILHVFNDNRINNTSNYRLGRKLGSTCDTLSGINEIGVNSIKTKIYPNPATDMLQVDLYTRDLDERLSFIIYDIVGKEILKKEIPLYQILVYRGNIATGIYTWQIQNDKHQIRATGKLVWN